MRIEDRHPDLDVELHRQVAIVEIRRPPHNYLDAGLIAGIADLYEDLGAGGACRAIVLAAAGKAFCAGIDHSKPDAADAVVAAVAREALRLFRTELPVVAAVQGAAVGGGLGLALSADFRVTCAEARYWPNFSLLGFHAGFGLTVTLPRLVGDQRAALLLYSGRRVTGENAVAFGLADVLVEQDRVRAHAIALAEEIAEASPIAVKSMRHTLRRDLIDALEAAMARELHEQTWQRRTCDFAEGTRAMAERRTPRFSGR
ncbi:MAG: enoyl-CoA hydratase/isomerase family protein [Sphingomonas sp.]